MGAGEAGGFIAFPPQLQAGFWPTFQMFHQTISLRSVICYLLEQIELRDITSQWLRKTSIDSLANDYPRSLEHGWSLNPGGEQEFEQAVLVPADGSPSSLESSLPKSCGTWYGGRHWAAGSSWVEVTWHYTARGHKPWTGYQGQSCDSSGQPPSQLGGFLPPSLAIHFSQAGAFLTYLDFFPL